MNRDEILAEDDSWFVHIKEYEGDVVVRSLGPFNSLRQAQKADAGLTRQMNHARFYSTIERAAAIRKSEG